MRRTLPLALALALTACGNSEPSAPRADPVIVTASADVSAGRVSGGIKIINDTEEPIAYAVWNRGWLALFAPCVSTGPDCPRLAPGESVVVTDDQIDGLTPDATEAVVRWWHIVPDGSGGVRAGEVHEVVVEL
jgi:hypothetical protein